MAEVEEIRMPDEPGRLMAHASVDVLMMHRTAHGEERPLLAGRCTTHHLRPNGVIVFVRPQLVATKLPPAASPCYHVSSTIVTYKLLRIALALPPR